MSHQTYTSDQVLQAVEMAFRMLGVTASPVREHENLDNNTSQESAPGTKLTLSVQEAADQMGICRPKMYELIRSGEVPSIHIGKKIRIPHQQFLDWVTKGDISNGKEAC